MLTVTSPSVVLSVPTTLVAVLPPLLRSATLRSTVSPASNNPFPSPLVPPRVSSSITGVRSASTGSVAGVIPIVVWNGRQLKEVTVSVRLPTLSARNGSTTLPEAFVVPTRYSSPGL